MIVAVVRVRARKIKVAPGNERTLDMSKTPFKKRIAKVIETVDDGSNDESREEMITARSKNKWIFKKIKKIRSNKEQVAKVRKKKRRIIKLNLHCRLCRLIQKKAQEPVPAISSETFLQKNNYLSPSSMLLVHGLGSSR